LDLFITGSCKGLFAKTPFFFLTGFGGTGLTGLGTILTGLCPELALV
jgi:hypothetical protein